MDNRNRRRSHQSGRGGHRTRGRHPGHHGTIDAASEAISVGVLDPGDMLVMYDSTIFIIALRALFEGIACATNHVFETYVEAGQEPRCLLAAGGGVQNRVWAQATSDISGRIQRVREKTLGASYGDAFLAALAVGDVRRGDIRTWNPVAHEIIPNPTTRDIYEHRYRTFRALYPCTRELMQ